MKIKKVSLEVQSALRTGISISDVTHCVSELVQNSLDAKATSIAVRLNLENFTLQVVDNGHGLTKEELDVIGCRYMTSKCHSISDLKRNLSYYGFRGESLASIRESCGVLMIISKTQACEQTHSKVFRANKESHNAVVSAHNRLCIGTTVIIKDFLHNFPVRRARIQPAIEMEYTRHFLIALSIINYKVSFTLRNDVTKVVILQTQEFNSSEDALKFHCNLKENHSLISVSSHESPFKISAHISRETETSGGFQFIYVNGRLVKNRRIYEFVNKLLSKSFFLRNIGKEVRGNNEKPKEKSSSVFIIHIQCPYSEYEIVSDPKKMKVDFKRWDFLEKTLEKVVDKFILSESNLYDASETSCNIQQNKENNLDAPCTADHNDHVVKSKVLYSKSVTRPIPELEISGNICEIPAQNANLEHSNYFTNHEVKSKEAENSYSKIDQLNTSCKYQQESDTTTRKAKEFSLVSAETVLADSKEMEIKKRRNKPLPYNSSTRILTTPSMNCPTKCKLKSPFLFKAPKPISRPVKRKHFTEHILTESESDISPSKKICSSETIHLKEKKNVQIPTIALVRDAPSLKKKHLSEHILTESESVVSSVKHMISSLSSGSKINNNDEKSILPIVSQDFFNDAVECMFVTQNGIHSLIETQSEKTSQQKFQVKLLRSLKQIPNSNALRLTQRNTFTFSDSEKGYVKCYKGTHSILLSKDSSTNLSPESKTHHLRCVQFPNVSEHYTEISTGKNIKVRNLFDLKRNNPSMKKLKRYKFDQNCKLFGPTSTRVKTTRSHKAFLKPKGLDSKLNAINQSSLPDIHVKTSSGNKIDPVNVQISSLTNQIHKPNPCKSILKPGQDAAIMKENNDQTKLDFKGLKHHDICSNKGHEKGQMAFSVTLTNEKNDQSKNQSNMGKRQRSQMKHAVTQTNDKKYQAKCEYNREKCHKSQMKHAVTQTNENNVQRQIKSNGGKIHGSQMKHKATHTNTYIHNNHENVEYNQCGPHVKNYYSEKPSTGSKNTLNNSKQLGFEHDPRMDNANQFLKFENIPSPSLVSPNLCFSPVNHTAKQSNIVNPKEYQQGKYYEQLQTCSSVSKHVSWMSPVQNVYFSPILSTFNFHPHNPVTHYKNCTSTSFGLKNLKYQQKLQDENLQNLFSSGRFKIAPNTTPKIIKLCQRSPTNEESSCNLGPKFVTKDEYERTKGYTVESPAINTVFPRHPKNKLFPFNFLKMESKKDCDAQQQPSIFQETKVKLPTHGGEPEKNPCFINADSPLNCDIKIKTNAPDSKHKNNVMPETFSQNDVNSPTNENRCEKMVTRENELKEQSSGNKIVQSHEQSSKCNITNWNKEITSNGKVIYINNFTGMSLLSTPKIDSLDTTFAMENRHWFMPKGVSPILHYKRDSEKNTKELSETEKHVVENIITANNVELETVKWRDDSANQGPETVLSILSRKESFGNWSASVDFKKPCAFSSESLSTAQVLGQVDRKFIAALLQPHEEIYMVLVLFDQHAVDERIRLESLLSGYKMTNGQLATHTVKPTLEINLSETDTTLLNELLPRIRKLGLDLLVQGNKVVVASLPLCMFNRYIREGENNEWLINTVEALVKQLLLLVQDGRGVMPSMPPLLSELINSEACRGSIKFGDVLTPDICRLLILKLATCEVPFQCAHGRPVLTPLIEVKGPENVVETINLERLSKRIQSSGTELVTCESLQQ